MTHEQAQEILDNAAARLSEHFGAVQICVSWPNEKGQTAATFSGLGDWYARRALCQEFVERDQADIIARRINATQPPPEGEEWKQA